MAKLKTKTELAFYRKYSKGGPLKSVKLNTIFLSKANTYEHELAKFNTAWGILSQGENFITEAERKATDEEKELFNIRKKIVDVVDIKYEQEYEIMLLISKIIQSFILTSVLPLVVSRWRLLSGSRL